MPAVIEATVGPNGSELPTDRGAGVASAQCGEALATFVELCGRGYDAAAARRAAAEAVRAFPGGPRRNWWRWTREAARSLDVPVRVVDARPRDVVALVHDGGAALTFLPHDGDDFRDGRDGVGRDGVGRDGDGDGDGGAWWVAGADGKRTLRLSGTGAEEQSVARMVAAAEASAAADPAETDRGEVRWLVAGRAGADLTQHIDAHGHASPYATLRALFAPESGDIRAIAVFALFVALLNLATPIAVESLVGTVAFGRLLQPVVVLATVLFGFLAFQAALRLLQVWVAELIQRRTFVRVAGDLARRLPRVTADGMAGHSPPELVNRFFDVVTVQKVAAGLLLEGLNLVLGAVIGLGILAFYHPYLLGFDLVLLAAMTVVTYLLGRGAVKTAIYESKQKYRTAAWLEELAANPTAFRHGDGVAFAVDRADGLAADYLKARRNHFRVLVRQVAFALGLQAVAATALLSLGGWLVINQRLTLGQLVAAELIVTLVLSSFSKLGKHLEAWYDLVAAGDKLGVLFALPTERTDGALTGIDRRDDWANPGAGTSEIAEPILRLENATVRGGTRFDLALAPGESVGLLAPPGAGKTALAEALFGRRAPLGGRIELDGLAPGDYRPDALRRRVALAGASPGGGAEVFAGTVAENVHLGRPDVTAADVRAVLKRVGLAERVDALPGGVDATLGFGGAPLGEIHARRLTLARALAGRPRLLVIDSLLDGCAAETAAELLAAAVRPIGGRAHATLVLTRRAEIAAVCDRALRPDGAPLDPAA
ncbi:ATP-binding cassette domain-containing protein [Alienimonas californiensis]|uniref:Putative multidrug resistance ABC transporter ATP-binding/permease protein YheI n=1 Tax=Alienimonas californiensis TaxID=2527989 RepID=A0A517P5I9_9PLAN|nr:ABC transporter ATP-binding protein [Alienimonas californiensis]QDT14631.1 putative multidrug resistance ABC transporter ATP-binding/permease protein YheI [Alienimonas californiensis]